MAGLLFAAAVNALCAATNFAVWRAVRRPMPLFFAGMGAGVACLMLMLAAA